MQPTPAPLDARTFAAVLVGAQAGEEWAAEALFIDLQPRLLRFLRSTEPRVADDIAGEVWLAIAKGMATFDGDLDGFRSWVFSIARRRMADFRRTAVRRRTDPVDYEYFTEFAAAVAVRLERGHLQRTPHRGPVHHDRPDRRHHDHRRGW